MPNIQGFVNTVSTAGVSSGGALYWLEPYPARMAYAYNLNPSSDPKYLGWGSAHVLYFDASYSNSIYSDTCNTMQPSSITINYYIKAK